MTSAHSPTLSTSPVIPRATRPRTDVPSVDTKRSSNSSSRTAEPTHCRLATIWAALPFGWPRVTTTSNCSSICWNELRRFPASCCRQRKSSWGIIPPAIHRCWQPRPEAMWRSADCFARPWRSTVGDRRPMPFAGRIIVEIRRLQLRWEQDMATNCSICFSNTTPQIAAAATTAPSTCATGMA